MKMPTDLQQYWLLLKDLSREQKLSLIELLAQSVKADTASNGDEKVSVDDWVHHLYGSWKDFPETAEEMISFIEGSRTMGRKIESL